MPPLLRTVPPRARGGAANVTIPHQKVVTAIDAMAATMRDLNLNK
jgi:hypothetical protein